MGYSAPITPGAGDAALARLPGYGPGGLTMTDAGELPVDWLETGDRVLTRDHGPQPVLWIGRLRLVPTVIGREPGFAPLEIAAGALGLCLPSHASALAPHTRVMLTGWEVALHTGEDEALAEIADLANGMPVTRSRSRAGKLLTCLLLPMHETVQINGLWAETLLLDSANRAALAGHLPEPIANAPAVTSGHAQAARLCLAAWEVAAILGGPRRGAPRSIDRVA